MIILYLQDKLHLKMKKIFLMLLVSFCFTIGTMAQQTPANNQNLIFLVDGKLLTKAEASKINKDSIEAITVIKEKKHKELFGINEESGLIIVFTKAKINEPENIEIKKKIAKIDFKSGRISAPLSRDSIANGVFDFVSIQKQPEFPGGIKEFYNYVQDNLVYPKNAIKNRIIGKVFLSFVVEKNGEISDIKVTRGLSPDFNNEAIRVLSNSPNWEPGINFGVPVRVKYNININFDIRNN